MVQKLSRAEAIADYFIITIAEQVFSIGRIIILHLMAANGATPTLLLLHLLFSECISVVLWPLGGYYKYLEFLRW